MRKHISNIFRFFIVLFLAVIFVSCSFLNDSTKENDSSQLITEDLSDSKATFTFTGTISISEGAFPSSFVNKSKASNSTRAAWPEIPTNLTYSITASDGTDTVEGTQTGNTSFQFVLQSGKEWTVTAILNDASGNPVLSDSWTIPASNKKANLFHRFWVKPVVTSGGTGTLALTLLLNNDLDGVVSKVTADCKSSTSNTENWEVSILPTEENMTFQEGSPLQVSISQASIASGQYEVSFNFYDASNVLVYNTVQTINIFDNLTTNTWVSGGGSAPIKSDGTFELTKDLVDGYSRTHLYVGATAFCTSPSNDNATGTAAKPFASVTGAIDYLRMVGSAEQDYTIYLVGSLDGGQTIEDSSDTIPAKSITLIGFNGLDSTNQPKDSIEASDTETALTISTEIPVTVKDLKISKGTGHGVDVSSSSKLYLAGTPVIDDLYLESTSTYDEEYYSPGSLLLAEDLGSFASITITPDTYTAPYYDDSEGGYIIKVQYVSIEEESTIDIAENSKYFSITPELDGDENPTDTEWIIDNDGCLNKYCILTFEGEGINSMTTQKVPCTYFEPGKLIEPTREGYLFKGYYYQKETEHWGGSQYSPEQQPSTYEMLSFDYKEADYEDEEGNTVTDSDYTFVNSDMTLYATWRCLTINNIYVDADNGADAAWCSQDGSTISLGDGSEGFPLRTLNSAFDLIKEINDATEDYTITISGLTSEYNLVVDDNLPVNSLTFKGISSAETDGIDCTGQALDNFNSVLQIATAAPVVIQNMKVKLALWSYEVDGAVMNVGSGSTVTLKTGTIFEGSGNSNKSKGAVAIEDDGTLIMEDGVTFRNFDIKGGAVNVKTGGTFTMNGGSFEDNRSSGTCGAVYVNGGTFTMNDGYIKNNMQDAFQRDYLLPQGAGVCVASGTFIMEGGHITNNESYVSNINSNYTTAGGGVFVYADGEFLMHGGEITDNHAYNKAKYSNGTTSDDSTAHSYGGGVCLQAYGSKLASFTMTGGTISGNTAGTSGNGIGFLGSLAQGATGSISLGAGAIITDNDIYLPSNVTITIVEQMTGGLPPSIRATITPQEYTANHPILNNEGVSPENEYDYFAVTPQSDGTITTHWFIDENGKLYKYSVGDLLLTDGTFVYYDESHTFSEDEVSATVGLVYGLDEEGKPRGILGLKNSSGASPYIATPWAPQSSSGNSIKFEDIICTPSNDGDTVSFTGDTDGSDNWDYICEIDQVGSADSATNYPAFNYVLNYVATAGLTDSDYDSGWYMPSASEMYDIYKNLTTINSVLTKIKAVTSDSANTLTGLYFWTSSQADAAEVGNSAWYINITATSNPFTSSNKDWDSPSVCCIHKYEKQ